MNRKQRYHYRRGAPPNRRGPPPNYALMVTAAFGGDPRTMRYSKVKRHCDVCRAANSQAPKVPRETLIRLPSGVWACQKHRGAPEGRALAEVAELAQTLRARTDAVAMTEQEARERGLIVGQGVD